MTEPLFFTKQSSEKYPIDINFTDTLEGETISTAQVEVYEGTVAVAGLIDSYDTVNDTTNGYYAVRIIVQNGEDGKKYKITTKIVTSNSNTYEEDTYMNIRDV
jgi:hypothetical protein